MRVLSQAVRRLSRARAFSLAAIVTFAFGIGGVGAAFTIVDSVLLRPFPYSRADQLVDISHTLQVSGLSRVGESDATYLGYQRHNHVFSGMALYRPIAVNLAFGNGHDAVPLRTSASLATGSLFHVLEVGAARGRTIDDADDAPGAPPVAVISARFWHERFGADPAILGHRILVDGVQRQIVGVMPNDFSFPAAPTDLWLPLTLDPLHVASAAFDYQGVARLRDGVSLARAANDLQRILLTVPDEFPGRLTAASIPAVHLSAVVRPLKDVVVGDAGHALWIVLAALSLLLLIACANIANLFVARAEGRQRELAVRRALGAGRATLLIEFLSEGLVIMAVGGVLGLLIAAGAIDMLRATPASASIPRIDEIHLNAAALAVVALASAITTCIVSAVSVIRVRSGSTAALLMSNGRGATAGRSRLRGRRMLVVVQVALALVLLVGAGLLTRSFARLRHVDPGFNPAHAVTLRVALPDAEYRSTGAVARFVVQGITAIAALPGVTGVGVTSKLPLTGAGREDSAVFVEDRAGASMGASLPDLHQIDFVTPGYFAAMGMRLTAGRAFAEPDPTGAVSTAPPEVVVSQTFARRYWGTTSPIGKRIRMNPTDPWSTIVGVVGDVRGEGLDQPASSIVYSPLVTMGVAGPWTPRNVAFVVRTTGDANATIPAVERATATLDPTLPLYDAMPVSRLVATATARTAFTLTMLAIAALVALGIGAVGIYGVIAYLVTLRTREIGVRLALGAQTRDVRRMVASQALGDALAGVAIGLVAAVVVTRLMASILFDTASIDVPTFALAAGTLLLTAFAASWVPAHRAAALDPADALRAD